MLLLSFTMFSQQPIVKYFNYVDKIDDYGVIATDYNPYKIEVDAYSWEINIANSRGVARFTLLDATIENGTYEGVGYVSAQMRNINTYEMLKIYLFEDAVMIKEGDYEYIFYNQN